MTASATARRTATHRPGYLWWTPGLWTSSAATADRHFTRGRPVLENCSSSVSVRLALRALAVAPRMSLASSPADHSLTVRELCFARAGERIFGPVSFALRSGDLCAISGANGAGKTSLIQVLAGLLAASEGSIEYGARAAGLAPPVPRIALLGHLNGLKLDLSASANLEFREALLGIAPALGIDAALARVGLAGYEHLSLRELSAGQRRRVALAALVRDRAALWLLDEPYANLDASGRSQVAAAIEEQRGCGGIVVLTTHGVEPLPAETLHVTLGAPT